MVLDQEAEIVVKPGIALDSEWRDRAGLNGCGPAEGSYMKQYRGTHQHQRVRGYRVLANFVRLGNRALYLDHRKGRATRRSVAGCIQRVD